jgi:DNA-binding NarL/FixJ family response regulator
MCNIMITDQNKMVRQWLVKRIRCSCIQGELTVCEGVSDALTYLANHDVDIVLTRIDRGDTEIEFAQSVKQKHLFTIVVGYGTCKDAGFLLKAMRNGVSFYSSNIYDPKELMNVLNKVYDQYRRQQMELKLRVEVEKRHTEKYYNSGLLQDWTADFCRSATKHNAEGTGRYIDYLCEVMDKQSFLSSKRMVIELLVILAGRLESEGMDLPVFPRSGEDYHLIISAGTVG